MARAPVSLSNWRSVRAFEAGVRQELRGRHWLRLHGWVIGLLVLGLMAGTATALRHAGLDSLALRYLLTVGAGYLAYLLVLRVWAAALLRRDSGLDGIDAADAVGDVVDAARGTVRGAARPPFGSGQGGDFGGGGASADFDLPDAGGDGVLEVAGRAAGASLEAAASADEGAIVVVPVVAVFFIGLFALLAGGSILFLYFGWEALLGVAVEVAFSYVSARTAVQLAREGWLACAVRLTWKPLLGAVLCAGVVGGLLDWLVPQAHSLPHAVQLWRGR